jgi:ribosomal protein S27E
MEGTQYMSAVRRPTLLHSVPVLAFLALTTACSRAHCAYSTPLSGCVDTDTSTDSTVLPVVLVIGGFLVYSVICGAASAAIANSKNRNAAGYFVLGAFFGAFGILAAAVTSSEPPKPPSGMLAVNCPRCGTRQNVSRADATFECWRCKLSSPSLLYPWQRTGQPQANLGLLLHLGDDEQQTTTAAPGWYPDANNPGATRYFDGQQWTAHTSQNYPS